MFSTNNAHETAATFSYYWCSRKGTIKETYIQPLMLEHPHVLHLLYKRHKDSIPKLERWAPRSRRRREGDGWDVGRDTNGTDAQVVKDFLTLREWPPPGLKVWVFQGLLTRWSREQAAIKCGPLMGLFHTEFSEQKICMTLERLNSRNCANFPPVPVVLTSGVFRPFESVTFALASSGFLDPRDSALGGMGTGIF